MKKVCIALACLAFGGVASALTIGWQWSPIDMDALKGSSYYMVYSTSGDLTAEQVVALASSQQYGATTDAIGATWGTSLDSSTIKVSDITYDVTPGANEPATGTGFPATDSTAWAKFDDSFFPNNTVVGSKGYLYFVIFNDANVTNATQFAVGKAEGMVEVNKVGQVVSGGQTPAPIDFLTPVWMGGTYQAAPEPTALALLALGIAGVALRRRIR